MKTLILIFISLLFFNLAPVENYNCGNGTPQCNPSPDQSNGPTIQTPNGGSISTYTFTPLEDCEVTYYNNEYNSVIGNASLGCPNSVSNCHGYAWHYSFGGSLVYIEGSDIHKYWDDDSFYKVNFIPKKAKTVVLYYKDGNMTHSAIGETLNGVREYRSKWQFGHLVKHGLTNVLPAYGTPTEFYLRCGACDTIPDMNLMTYNWGSVNTINFVSVGGYYLNTNLHHCQLNNDISWNAGGNNWGSIGTKKVSAWFNLTSGQSITFSISAPSNCGTSTRNVTFVAQSGYRMFNTVKYQTVIS